MSTPLANQTLAPLSLDDLAQYEPFVRSIARSLLGSEEEVQDVVQETWLHTLRRPPQGVRSPRSWLARVTRNLASDRRRGDARRLQREEACARMDEEEAVDVGQSRLEGHRLVVSAVLALDEPYRTVVTLRYYRGISPARIAERLGRKPATVRSQLHRAHELLREYLDGEFGGERGAWVGVLLPFLKSEHVTEVVVGGKSLLGTTGTKLALAAALTATAWLTFSVLGEDEVAPARGQQRVGLVDAAESGVATQSSSTDSGSNTLAASVPDERRVLSAGLEVRAQQDELPVAEADVWVLTQADIDLEEVQADEELARDPAAVIRRYGLHGTTNAAGKANLDWRPGPGVVLAERPGWQGRIQLTGDERGPVVVELLEVVEVSARVVDQRGRSLEGVPVSLRVGVSEDSVIDLLTHESAGPDGLVHFRGFTDLVRWEEPGEVFYRLRIGVPGVDTRETTLDLEAVPDEPIVLVLEPTGSLEVHTLDGNGRPLALDSTVRLSLGSMSHAPRLEARMQDGVARFPYVGLGISPELSVEAPAEGVHWTAFGRGPSTPGEVAVIEVVAPGRPVVEGRVVLASGAAVANAELQLVLRDEQRKHLHQMRFLTDEQGRFSAELHEKIELDSTVLVMVLQQQVDALGRADHDAPVRVREAVLPLGDLTLNVQDNVIAGRCVDETGEPITGLQISAEQDYWRISSSDKTDAEGRFRLTGVWPTETTLSVRDENFVLVEPRAVRGGQRDLQVRLARGGAISGSVLTGEDLAPISLEVIVYDQAGTMQGADWTAYERLQADGTFQATGLPAGRYLCRVLHQSAVLAEVADLVVHLGEANRDARLQAVDLTRRFTALSFRVVAEDGERIRPTAVVYLGGRTIAYSNGEEGQRIELRFPGEGDPLILVRAPGYLTAFLEADADVEELELQSGLRLTLRTQQRVELERGERKARLSLQRIETDERLPELALSAHVPDTLATGGEASVVFPAPGTYRLCVSIHQPASGGMVMASTAEPIEGDYLVEVSESDRGRDLAIALPESLFP